LNYEVNQQNIMARKINSNPGQGKPPDGNEAKTKTVGSAQIPENTQSRIDTMSVEDTANWIMNLGTSKSWKQAKSYSNSFKWNEISGSMLRNLSAELLKSDLNITNYVHRCEIMSSIQHLVNSMIQIPQDSANKPQNETLPTSQSMASHGNWSYTSMPMSVEQTANWIFTIGKSESWKEAKSYADIFKYNEINGFTITNVTDQVLESDLNIKNSEHRREIMSWISRLSALSGVQEENATWRWEPQGFTCGIPAPVTDSYSTILHRLCSKDPDSSCHPQSVETSEDNGIESESYETRTKSSIQRYLSSRPRIALLLKTSEDELEDICRKFNEFGYYDVVIEPVENQLNCYTVKLDPKSARRALYGAKELGYNLEMKLPKQPNSSTPISFRCLTGKILKSKSNKTEKIWKDKIVLVDKLKRGRARLVKKLENGKYKPDGWIPLLRIDGSLALELAPVNDG